MPDIMTLTIGLALVFLMIVVFQIYRCVRNIMQQQEKQTRIISSIAKKHRVSDSELAAIDKIHDRLMW